MTRKTLVGMLHLPALPGAPESKLSLDAIEKALVAEARTLREAGFDAFMLENFGDVPFEKDGVAPVTVAAMARLATTVRREVPELDLGINVLRNDARAALAVATAAGASFIRVNVHVGVTATDQGLIEGRARKTLRERSRLGVSVAVWSDVFVKHGRSLAHRSVAEEAEDAVKRGLADALIVSGSGTGKETSLDDLRAVAARKLGVPLYVGSGATPENVCALLEHADGVIVGTSIKKGSHTTAPIDPDRAKSLVETARGSKG